jgi:hypothetical protein
VGTCSVCGGEVERKFRFCPWCASPQRTKLVEFFRPHAAIERDRGKALRVSRYLGETDAERHTRFSVWSQSGRAEGVVSLDDAETVRLTRFLLGPAHSGAGLRAAVERAFAKLR